MDRMGFPPALSRADPAIGHTGQWFAILSQGWKAYLENTQSKTIPAYVIFLSLHIEASSL